MKPRFIGCFFKLGQGKIMVTSFSLLHSRAAEEIAHLFDIFYELWKSQHQAMLTVRVSRTSEQRLYCTDVSRGLNINTIGVDIRRIVT